MNHAIVVRTFAEQTVTSIRQTIGYIAAPVISAAIRPNCVLGMAGGRTLYELVRSCSRRARSRDWWRSL